MCGSSVCLRAYVCVLSSFLGVGFLARAMRACIIPLLLFFFDRDQSHCSCVRIFLCFFVRSRALLYVSFPFVVWARAMFVSVCICLCLYSTVFVNDFVCTCVSVCDCACDRVCVCV